MTDDEHIRLLTKLWLEMRQVELAEEVARDLVAALVALAARLVGP